MLIARPFAGLAALSLVVATATGCPPPVEPPPPPPPDDECELDLNFDTTGAGDLAAGPGSGVLCPSFDTDLWAFETTAPGSIVKVTVSMEAFITNVDPAYKIIKDNGTPEGEPTPFSAEDPNNNPGAATNFTGAHRLEDAGRYYVAVQDARFVDNAFDILNPYTVSVELVQDPDVNEPNNTQEAATPKTAGTFTGQIATTADQDWYAIDVPGGAQIVDVTVTAPDDSGVEHVATLFAADGFTELLAFPLAAGPAGSVSARLRSRADGGETVYLVVRDAEDVFSQLDPVTGTYTVALTVLANPDTNEGALGNDDASTATPITSGGQLNGVIATTADQDLYKIAAGGGTSRTNPQVLLITIETDAALGVGFEPQVAIVGVDPELAVDQQTCNANCPICDNAKCKEQRLQRFIDGATFRTAFPLRDQEAVFILVNEAGDDAFQEGTGYSIRTEIIDDPDPGEVGDDFLIPNLEFAGFDNNALNNQLGRSLGRARVLATSYPPVCTAPGTPAGCLELVDVPEPIDGINPAFTRVVSCAGLAPQTITATGRLTYEGDRDFFRFDVPSPAYFAFNFTYSATGEANTPVELALFVRSSGGGLIGNTLEAPREAPVIPPQPGCRSSCCDTRECAEGSVCVDGDCWGDPASNATFTNHTFPSGVGDCSFASVTDRGPYFLEVVDNGLNDFDVDVTYTFTLDILCGCPAECNFGDGLTTRCQGVVDPT